MLFICDLSHDIIANAKGKNQREEIDCILINEKLKRQWLQVCQWTFIFETLIVHHL